MKFDFNDFKADCCIIFAGLNHDRGKDCENFDRKKLTLPKRQIKLIKKTAKSNPNTIVVLINGSPIAMDEWIDDVPVILEAWYPGMEGGKIIAKVLFGDINPSGKLPITFPKKLTDSPAHKTRNTFPGNSKVFYEEGIFVAGDCRTKAIRQLATAASDGAVAALAACEFIG